MAKKIFRYPIYNQSVKIILIQETIKKQKDKPEIPGFEVVFVHNKLLQSCFMEKSPPKEGNYTGDIEIYKNFDGHLEAAIVSLKPQ